MHEPSTRELLLQSKYILRSLQRADEALAAGIGVDQVCQLLGISVGEYLIWRRASASTSIAMMTQLAALEEENRGLRHLIADQRLRIQILENRLSEPGTSTIEERCV